ncbi:MAG: hypothetical protein V4598_05305 [Bdellovibrionota bacterium]
MKTFLVIIGFIIASSAIAAPSKLAVCDADDLKSLAESILDAKKDGLVNAKLMKNLNGKTVGFYAYNKKGDDMIAEVCEYMETDDMVVASKWYYWEADGFKTNPAAWTRNGVYSIRQDEGGADLTMLKPDAKGNVKLEISILGMGEDDFVEVRKDVVLFSDK